MSRDGSVLVNVNAGSNTISAFAVTPRGLRLIGTASSGGTDPDSVTIAGDNVVYVLNAGSETIAGFRLSPGRLGPIPHSVQPLGVGALVLRLHRERGQRQHRPLRRRARRHPHRPRQHADRERPDVVAPRGGRQRRPELPVRPGPGPVADRRLPGGRRRLAYPGDHRPGCRRLLRRRRLLRPPATVIHRPRDAEAQVLPHPAGI